MKVENKIEQFVEAFKKLEDLGFEKITFYPDESGDGELLVDYNNMGFSIQLYEYDGDIDISLCLTIVKSNGITFEYDEIEPEYSYSAYMSDFDTVEEAVQDMALKIIACDVSQKYDNMFSTIKEIRNKFSMKEWNLFTKLIHY